MIGNPRLLLQTFLHNLRERFSRAVLHSTSLQGSCVNGLAKADLESAKLWPIVNETHVDFNFKAVAELVIILRVLELGLVLVREVI